MVALLQKTHPWRLSDDRVASGNRIEAKPNTSRPPAQQQAKDSPTWHSEQQQKTTNCWSYGGSIPHLPATIQSTSTAPCRSTINNRKRCSRPRPAETSWMMLTWPQTIYQLLTPRTPVIKPPYGMSETMSFLPSFVHVPSSAHSSRWARLFSQ